ncbi:MAG: patatin-like phospholipase family protein [Verrucomicrobiota bacterium]|nr:patatin-like phospholipase family protein [Verrucomicrobiota bacterium]
MIKTIASSAISGASWMATKIFARPYEIIDRQLNSAHTTVKKLHEYTCVTFKDITNRLCTTFDLGRDKILDKCDEVLEEVRAARVESFRIANLGTATAIALGSAITTHHICGDKDDFTCNVAHTAAKATTVLLMFFAVIILSKISFRMRANDATPPQLSQIDAGLLHPNPNDPTYTALMQAAYAGNEEEILRLQREGAFLEAKDGTGKTALHWAAIGQQLKALEWLWFFGCDFKVMDSNYLSPIHFIKKGAPLYVRYDQLAKIKSRFDHEHPIYLFYPPENLVFKGGGPKGIAYVGVQQFLENHDLLRELKRVAGTSAGAITAILVALGYNGSELEEVLGSTDLKDFLDHEYQNEQSLLTGLASMVKKGSETSLKDCSKAIKKGFTWWYSPEKPDSHAATVFKDMYKRGGLCKGEKFLAWIEELIQAKTGIPNCTFEEYRALLESKKFKHVYFYATQIDPEKIVCFNSEDPEWDQVVIAHAVRASMSIPLVFAPHTLHIKLTKEGEPEAAPRFGTFMDGGLLKNCPLDRFDRKKYSATNTPSSKVFENHQTLGFNLVDPPTTKKITKITHQKTIAQVSATSIRIFASAEELLLSENSSHQKRLVNIDNQGVGLVSGFFADEKAKKGLIESAKKSMREFFKGQRKLATENAAHSPQTLSIFAQPFGERGPVHKLEENWEVKEPPPPPSQLNTTTQVSIEALTLHATPLPTQKESAKIRALKILHTDGNQERLTISIEASSEEKVSTLPTPQQRKTKLAAMRALYTDKN